MPVSLYSMAKLYFRYGTVGSAKTLNLLAVAHNYRQQNKKIILIKPSFDTRFGVEKIKSRAGLEVDADVLVSANTVLAPSIFNGASCILVDEAQFLSSDLVDQLREITHLLDIPVICYGLRSDFKSGLFPGSARLFEIADTIEEVKTTCTFCNRKAIMNLKHLNGIATLEGASLDLGGEEKFLPACYACYKSEIQKGNLQQNKRAVG